MSIIRIRIAERVFEIKSIYPLAHAMWHKFYTDMPIEYRVQTTHEGILHEAAAVSLYHKEDGSINSKIEALVIHREICDKMIDYNTFMIHGAALAVNGKGILFCGKSGVGKTTHLFKWLDNCDDAIVISGDKPFVIAEKVPFLCGSPWAGKENMCNNIMVPMNSIILMERAEENHIERIPFAEAFPSLLQQVYRPDDEAKMRKTLQLMRWLNPAVMFWRFQCNNFKDDCFDAAYNALVRDQP